MDKVVVGVAAGVVVVVAGVVGAETKWTSFLLGSARRGQVFNDPGAGAPISTLIVQIDIALVFTS